MNRVYFDDGGQAQAPDYQALVAKLTNEFPDISENSRRYVWLQIDGFHPTLALSGFRNHRDEAILNMFRWIAVNAPGSYGYLYTRDPEDDKEYDRETQFRVFRLFAGEFEELPAMLELPGGKQRRFGSQQDRGH